MVQGWLCHSYNVLSLSKAHTSPKLFYAELAPVNLAVAYN